MIAILALALIAQAQPWPGPQSPKVAALEARVQAGDAGAVDAFWTSVTATPLIEEIPHSPDRRLVTFLWRGDASTRHVVVMSELGGYTNFSANMMRRVMGTDIWSFTYVVSDDARFTYFLAPNDPMTPLGEDPRAMAARLAGWKMDPLNPKQTPVPGRMASYVEMPKAPPQPFVARRANVARGKVELPRFRSEILSNDRQLSVYTPPGYSKDGDSYPLLILLDGIFYTFFIPTPAILDNMIAEGVIHPLVMVVVDTLFDRDRELSCNPVFTDMLADELLPWIRERYHVARVPADIVVGGTSLAGLAAACAALRRPAAFGGVISQSGSFWWGHEGELHEWLRRQVEIDRVKPVRFYLDVGLMETGPIPGDGPDMVTVNRRMREALRAKGYQVTYQEFNGGHEFVSWRGTISDALKAMFK